jgi:hypothetical protein
MAGGRQGDLAEWVKAKAAALGFNLAGITPAVPSPELDAYLSGIEAGYHGSMGYLARPDRVERRRDLNVIQPGARSLIVAGLDYASLLPEAALADPARGRISNYAWGLGLRGHRADPGAQPCPPGWAGLHWQEHAADPPPARLVLLPGRNSDHARIQLV